MLCNFNIFNMVLFGLVHLVQSTKTLESVSCLLPAGLGEYPPLSNQNATFWSHDRKPSPHLYIHAYAVWAFQPYAQAQSVTSCLEHRGWHFVSGVRLHMQVKPITSCPSTGGNHVVGRVSVFGLYGNWPSFALYRKQAPPNMQMSMSAANQSTDQSQKLT